MPKKRRSKFNNIKTRIDGYTFDSKVEASRYVELKQMQQAGLIKDLILQKSFELIPSFKKNQKNYRKCSYICDFQYYDNQKNKTIIEDVKGGILTDVYLLKKKMFEHRYPELEIEEIRRK